jgi:hypothetical protein
MSTATQPFSPSVLHDHCLGLCRLWFRGMGIIPATVIITVGIAMHGFQNCMHACMRVLDQCYFTIWNTAWGNMPPSNILETGGDLHQRVFTQET